MDSQNLLDFDELKTYYGYDYYPTSKIKISQPSVGDIIEFGDVKFYSIVYSLCGNPTMYRLQLWKNNINWNKISDFSFFCQIIKNFTVDDTKLLFGDLDLSSFELFHDNQKNCDVLVYIERDKDGNITTSLDDAIIIDEVVYTKLVEYIRYMFNIHPKTEHAKNKATAEAIIWEDEMNEKYNKENSKDNKVEKSILLPMISMAVNHPGFKYKKNELKDVGIVEFMDSIQRLNIYESTRALYSGLYSGMCDLSKVDKKEFDFARKIN